MSKVFIALFIANVSLWSFNAGTVYDMLEPMSDPECQSVTEVGGSTLDVAGKGTHRTVTPQKTINAAELQGSGDEDRGTSADPKLDELQGSEL